MNLKINIPDKIYNDMGGTPSAAKTIIKNIVKDYWVNKAHDSVLSQVQQINDDAESQALAELDQIEITEDD
jgi:hypothetical protein